MPNDEPARGDEQLAEAADDASDVARATAPAKELQGAPRSAWRRAMWWLFLGLAAAVFVADQLTKTWLVGLLGPGESVQVMGDWVRLVHTRNTGALFGLFRDQAPVFALFSMGVIGLIAWFHGRSGRSPLMSVTLGLLLGGAIGNLADRLRLGHVVDFVDIGIGGFRWYTFNVADAAISCALLLLVLIGIVPSLARGDEPPVSPASREPDA
jgi:signal peptidase II